MTAKFMLLILAGTTMSVGLLVVRQQRLQAVHDMTRALERAAEHDRTLWAVRSDIARALQPDEIHALAVARGFTTPIPRQVCDLPATALTDASRPAAPVARSGDALRSR
ncbi:MAG: hypothetical protein SFZ24_07690 [Planctomycetota bacterium]|nr:hypothetical protein [Planctomycetota bacterium]